jgi:spore coat polysaccharide biosynthesis protein SpsF
VRTVAIIQAHMGSSRLPGKVMLDLGGRPVLRRVVDRARAVPGVDEVVVACATLPQDDVLEAACREWGVPVFRGSDGDVLERFRGAAEAFHADACVRITSDCPLLDPGVSGEIVRRFREADPPVDYASNKIPQSFPRGLDTEVFTRAALERAAADATEAYERAHVTIHLYEHPERYRLLGVTSDVDRAEWRWTLDTADDLRFLREVYARLGPGDGFAWTDVVALLQREPDLLEINRHVVQKGAHEG